MTSKLFHLGSSSVIALAIVGASPALAAGTIAGTPITNTASVDYQVAGVSQTQVVDGDTFVVDRRINLTVAENGTTTTTVVPNQTGAITRFTLLNSSNAALDFALTVTQTTGGTASHGGTDTFDITTPQVYLDNNGDGIINGADAVITFVDELAADGTVNLLVVGAIPNGLATGAVANVRLTATARESGAVGQGAAITQTAGPNTVGSIDTVFGDAAGPADALRDAAHSDDDDYTVSTATITVDKRSTLISDPVNGTTLPRMIPGAVIEYCIAISNAAGGAAASTLVINDILPTELTFVTGSILLNGTTTGLTCNADGTAGGTYTSGTRTINGSVASVAAGATRTVVFRATVN